MWSSSGFNVALLDNELSNLYKAACMDLFGIQLNLLLEKPNWQHLKEKVNFVVNHCYDFVFCRKCKCFP